MTFRKPTAWAFAMIGLSSVALLGACSGKVQQSTPVAQADLPAAYAHAVCDNIQGCCAQAKFTYDDGKCVAAFTAELQKELALITSTYDANAAGDCVALIKSASAACTSPTEAQSSTTCGHVFTGPKKIGETCDSAGSDCAPSSEGEVVCDSWTSTNNVRGSECVLVRPAQAGDACGFSVDGAPPSTRGDCDGNKDSAFYCNSAHTCQPRLAIGAVCTASSAYTCVNGAGCVSGTCAPAPTAGQTCDDAFQCADGFYCQYQTRKCAAKHAAGDACDNDSSTSCASGACESGVCGAGGLANKDTCAGNASSSSGNGSSGGSSSSGSGSSSGGGSGG